MSRFMVHIHRSDKPGKCFWLRDNGLLTSDAGMADEFDNVAVVAEKIGLLSDLTGARIEAICVRLAHANVPESVRAVVRL